LPLVAAAPPPARGAPPSHPPSTAIRAVAQYCTADRQYGGLDHESLTRARSNFASICDAFSVLRSLRATCIPFALRMSEHNLPALAQDSRGLSEEAV